MRHIRVQVPSIMWRKKHNDSCNFIHIDENTFSHRIKNTVALSMTRCRTVTLLTETETESKTFIQELIKYKNQ